MVLRITQGMMNTQLLTNLNRNLTNLNKYQEQLATGRKINKPSDDPVGLSYSLRYRTDIAANQQYIENVDSSISWLDFTDTMLGQAGDVLHRARELAVKAANTSNEKSAMEAIKLEMIQLTKQLVTVGNSQFNGKYVFNGQLTDVAPYSELIEPPATSGTYKGNVNVSAANVTGANNLLSLLVDGETANVAMPLQDYSVSGGAAAFASDLQTAINTSLTSKSVTVSVGDAGNLVITSDSKGKGSSVEVTGGTFSSWLSNAGDYSDVTKQAGTGTDPLYTVHAKNSDSDYGEIYFEIATGLKVPVNLTGEFVFGSTSEGDNAFKVMNEMINKIETLDYKGVSDLLGVFDTRMNKVLEARANVGAKMNRVDFAHERLKDIDLNLQSLQSKTENADVAEVITIMKTYENVYQASLSVGSKVIKPSLVDFLR